MTKLAGECSSWAIHKLGVLGACVCRKYWEEESGKKGDRLDVESMIGTGAGTEHEMLLKRAKVLYGTLFGATKEVARWLLALARLSSDHV